MVDEILKHCEEAMLKSEESLKKDFRSLRSSQVSASMLSDIKVSYYDVPTPISQVASVIAQDATTIIITPWEKNILDNVEKALSAANLGASPTNDGECVKLFFPPMTSDQRELIAKDARGMGEKAKVSARNNRQDANNKIKKLLKDKDITEDESKKGQDRVQKVTDEAIKTIEEMVKKKEADIKHI